MRYHSFVLVVTTALGIFCSKATCKTNVADLVAAASDSPDAAVPSLSQAKLPLTRSALLQLNDDFRRPHEAAPEGVPSGYDWYAKPRRGLWNAAPPKYAAMTGWGQAFWARGTVSPTASLLLKNNLTLVCHGSPHRWSLVQSAKPAGANFRADFVANAATKAISADVVDGEVSAVQVPVGRAYHFWPKMPRASIPPAPLCGVLVLVQARAEPIASNSYDGNLLLGMGADYWLDKTAAWDNYKTNSDIAIGRLKRVGTSWAWYGLSTASDDDLQSLFDDGYQVD